MKILIILLIFSTPNLAPNIQTFNTLEQCRAFRQLNHAWQIETSDCVELKYKEANQSNSKR